MNDADYKRVQRWLERQRRVEQTAAVSLGLLATYQAVINGKGDPEILDVMAKKTLDSFPQQPEVSLDDAKRYVKNIKGNVSKVKDQYEAMLRKVHGNARYEAQFKSSIDAMFRQAEQAENQKSVTQMANESGQKYQVDRKRCYDGQSVSAGSLVSPVTCKKLRKLALEGKPLPGTNEAGAGSAKEESSGGGLGAPARQSPGIQHCQSFTGRRPSLSQWRSRRSPQGSGRPDPRWRRGQGYPHPGLQSHFQRKKDGGCSEASRLALP